MADAIGKSYKTVQNYERGTTTPDSGTLAAIAEATGMPADELLSGKVLPPSQSDGGPGLPPDVAADESRVEPLDAAGPLVRIDSVNVTASAGDGDEVDIEVVDGHVFFPEAVARDLFGAPAERVKRITISGTSMLPTLQPGQRAYVVLMQPWEEPADGAVYVIRGPQGILIKRLHFEADNLGDGAPSYYVRVASDNPEFADSRFPLEVFRRDFVVVAHLRRAELAL